MTRAGKKARLARAAVRVLAQQSAKNAVKNHLRRQGLKLWDFTSKEITLRAEAMLKEHPEMFAEARAKAVSLGFVQEIAQ